MTPRDIEAWAGRIVGALLKGQTNEDARVEFKSQWPEAPKAARRIAGHCNAAGGEPVLWLIGVDQHQGIVPYEQIEVSRWWSEVKSMFDGTPPPLIHVECRHDDQPFTALLFDSSFVPYVIKIPENNAVTREVPWREATAVRTSRRHELQTILRQAPWQGTIRAFSAGVTVLNSDRSRDEVSYTYQFHVSLYFSHEAGSALVLPLPRALAGVMPPSCNGAESFDLAWLGARALDDIGPASSTQVVVQRSGSVRIEGGGPAPTHVVALHNLCVAVGLRTASDRPAVQVVLPLVLNPRRERGALPNWIAFDKDRWLDATPPQANFPHGLEKNKWFEVFALSDQSDIG